MIWLKLTAQKTTFLCLLVLLLANSLLYPPPVLAQSQPSSSLAEKIKRFFFGDRPGGAPSGRLRGGAVRGRCPGLAQQEITALVPATNKGVPFVEQTIAERPTFWFYVPYSPVSQLNAEFVLLDEQEENVYSAVFPLNQKSGIVELQLPKIMPPLQQGNKYRWVFSAICNPQNRAADAIVHGWIERVPVSPALNNQLKVASARERIPIYTDSRLWYETLTALAKLQHVNAHDEEVRADWADVMQLVGLPKDTPQTWAIYYLPSPE